MDITLALGGGGVKGSAHVGVLRALDREGIRIKALAGTSAGGLWGGFYAAGYPPDDIMEVMNRLDPDTMYNREQGDGPALLGLAGIRDLLNENLGGLTFDKLKIPFAVTAVNLNTAELVIIQNGLVAEAILATIAIPGIFPPVNLGGETLIDGGLLDPVPVRLARSLSPNLPVVSVVLSPALDGWAESGRPSLFDSIPYMAKYIAKLRIAKALDIFLRSVDIAGVMMTELRLQNDLPEIIIRPDVPQAGLLDKIDPREFARMGEMATQAALPKIYQSMPWYLRLKRKMTQYFTNFDLTGTKNDA
ncbi:MAG TPA: patatin-like phospholipase family protein [Anaerolineales bacterium]|nr:patatin-like phospholipase family protein [Anaerolineales bacterium]